MRQFTGHEDLNGVGLIHMNGRVYDPELGRFLSADPNVQFSHDPQSFNRYSYVLNNPLSFTDPSGYFLKRLMGSIHKFLSKYGRTIVAIGVTFIVPNPFAAGFISGMVSSGGDLKTAVISGITAQAFDFVGANIADKVGKIAAHAFIGGASARAQGGDFKSGFLAAGFTQISSQIGNKFGLYFNNPQGIGQRLSNALTAAVVGGTASKIGGGKFANGAVTGAFSRVFNDDNHVNCSDGCHTTGPNGEIALIKDANGAEAGGEYVAHPGFNDNTRDEMYGPFHRLESPTQTQETAALQVQSQEVWGQPSRFSDIPAVKAYNGPLPNGARGIEFTTVVRPTPGATTPGNTYWYKGTPGVRIEGDYAIIPANVYKNTQR